MRKIFDDINDQLDKVFNTYNEAFLKDCKVTADSWNKILEQYKAITKEYINPLFGRFYFVKDVLTFLFNAREKYQEYKTKIDNWFKEHEENIIPLFRQDKIDRSRNDFQMDGYYDYDKKAFIETIFHHRT